MKQSIVDQKHLDGPDRASCSKSTVLVNQLAAGESVAMKVAWPTAKATSTKSLHSLYATGISSRSRRGGALACEVEAQLEFLEERPVGDDRSSWANSGAGSRDRQGGGGWVGGRVEQTREAAL